MYNSERTLSGLVVGYTNWTVDVSGIVDQGNLQIPNKLS